MDRTLSFYFDSLKLLWICEDGFSNEALLDFTDFYLKSGFTDQEAVLGSFLTSLESLMEVDGVVVMG